MKFEVAGSKIICSRIDTTVEDDIKYRPVVEFDAHLDEIAPHVAAKLTQGETAELERFLADRRRIRANPAQVNMLEVLPELIGEAIEILNSVNRLNQTMYRQLHASVARLSEALENVKPKHKGKVTPIRQMGESEALKERLENIKRDL